MARSNVKRKGLGRKTFAIIVDGETEKWYLDMLRRNENPCGITIKPDLPQKTKFKDQFATVKENANIFDISVWIIDLDVVIKENNVQELAQYINEITEVHNIHILINTPCLEFWFLQHVQDSGKYFSDCESVIKELKKNNPIKQYDKSEKYFVNTNPDIYKRLKGNLAVALKNAAKRGSFDPANPKQGKAEIYKLFELLGLKI